MSRQSSGVYPADSKRDTARHPQRHNYQNLTRITLICYAIVIMTNHLKPETILGIMEIAKKMGHTDVVNPLEPESDVLAPLESQIGVDNKDSQSIAADSIQPDIVDDYIAELILDLVTRKHVKLADLQRVRSVFRAVLKTLSDGESHTYSEIRSTVTASKRDLVERILVKLQAKRIILRVEREHRIYYRLDLELRGSVCQYIINTMERV